MQSFWQERRWEQWDDGDDLVSNPAAALFEPLAWTGYPGSVERDISQHEIRGKYREQAEIHKHHNNLLPLLQVSTRFAPKPLLTRSPIPTPIPAPIDPPQPPFTTILLRVPLRTPLRLLRLRLTPLLTSPHSHRNHPRAHSTIQCTLVTVWLPPFCGQPSTRIRLAILRLRWAWRRTLWLRRFGLTPLLAAAHGDGDHTRAYGAVQGALVAVGRPA
jgi:hypothetical protein